MTKIIMLGTGAGGTLNLYNTCFVILNDEGNFLVDAGGSIEILKRLNQVEIKLDDINDIFISHSHTDHILGFIWILKKIGSRLINGAEIETINVYCNDVVFEAVKGIAKYTLPESLLKRIYNVINFVVLNDGDKYTINGVTYEFFDILARGTKQFGFECVLNGKRLVFLGDETLNVKLYDRVRGADYVMHEAFCLDSEENIFHAYEKNHSTVKTASEVMNGLDVKNLILYHTEDSHGDKRKGLYLKEGKENFDGVIYVPDEFDIIEF